ncbi:MAG: L,D-transpeptidase [Syntrophobacteraceae bacterium]|jgi:hypothetical protein|nr:L,D-transpeptidase [Syntrophobacteraceae bacterium]
MICFKGVKTPLMLARQTWIALIIGCTLLSGCMPRKMIPTPEGPTPESGWTERKITKTELNRISGNDAELDHRTLLDILARLNARDRDYIEEDIKKGRKLKVPKNFKYYRNWTPLPRQINEVSHLPKFVLVVKSQPFIGWYEKGHLMEDSYICIGKKGEWTKAGLYKILKKDENHVSASYRNAYGQPALMPWALRIYGHVWIHAGDIEGPYCSRGCINLPIAHAARLFDWADAGTTVLVVESLKDLNKRLPRKPVKSTPEKPDPARKPAIKPAPARPAPAKPTPARTAPAKASPAKPAPAAPAVADPSAPKN